MMSRNANCMFTWRDPKVNAKYFSELGKHTCILTDWKNDSRPVSKAPYRQRPELRLETERNNS